MLKEAKGCQKGWSSVFGKLAEISLLCVIWASWHLKSLTIQLFVQQLVQANNKGKWSALLVLSPHKRPVKHFHDDVLKWKHFRVTGHLWSPLNSPHKGQWRGALMFSLLCAWINVWVNNGEADDLRCHRAHYDVILMGCTIEHTPSPKQVRIPFVLMMNLDTPQTRLTHWIGEKYSDCQRQFPS